MSIRFDETIRGQRFYDAQLPRLIKAIEENTKELKRANEIKIHALKQLYEVQGGASDENSNGE